MPVQSRTSVSFTCSSTSHPAACHPTEVLRSEGLPAEVVAVRLRAQARSLLRAARGDGLSQCLPALRRLHAAKVFDEIKLSALVAQRQQIRLKHCLRTLAREFGYASWEAMQGSLDQLPLEQLNVDGLYAPDQPSLNLWFGSLTEAGAYMREHGGRLLRVGRYAVVSPLASSPI